MRLGSGETYCAPTNPLASFQAAASRQGRRVEEKGGKGRKIREGEGSVPHFFFYNLNTGWLSLDPWICEATLDGWLSMSPIVF